MSSYLKRSAAEIVSGGSTVTAVTKKTKFMKERTNFIVHIVQVIKVSMEEISNI